jgi:uncharacterized RDD family membrane protein YckC
VPTLTITTPEGIVLHQEIAGAGSRFVAALLDGILLCLLWTMLLLVTMVLAQADPTGLGSFATGLALGGALLIALGYQFLCLHFMNGQTPGKRALGLRVKAADGHPASTFQLFMRSLIWIVDVLVFLPVSLGLYLIVLTPRRQRLGDLAAGTLVLREEQGEAPREPYEQETWSDLDPRRLPLTPALARRLRREDRQFLRELLTRRGVERDKREQLMSEAADLYRERLGLDDEVPARDTLKEVYLFLREFPPEW